MATALIDILQDPNYVNANEPTKRAIFDKYAPLDQNYAKANAATQEAIRIKFGVAQPRATESEGVPTGPRAEAPSPREDHAWYTPSGVAQTVGNIAAGAFRGAGSIGATLIRPFETAEENAARRRAMDEELQTLGAQPESLAYDIAKIGGEIAGTLPIGGVVAKPLAYAATRVPALAPYITPVATAVESSGFTAGKKVRGLPALGARTAGGAVTGAATAGLTAPEETATGAGVGAGLSLVAPPIANTLAKSSGFLIDAFSGKLAEIKAGKIARDVAGDRIGAIRAALLAAPEDVTAAQAASGIQRNEWQALGAMAAKNNETSALLKRQADDDLAELQRLAEGGNATEARAAYEQSIKRLNQLTDDMRNVELQAANQAGQTINRLTPQLEQRQESMVNALRGGMPTGAALPGQATISPVTEAAQQAATAAKGKPGFLTAGTRAQEWQKTSDIFADIAKQRRAESGFIERQIGSLADHGLQPLDAGAITGVIDAKLNQPGLRASSNVTKVLQAIKDDINNLTAKGGGVIDANDLYTLRKEGINERIAQILGQTDPKVSAKVTNKMLQEIRPLIDDAIEKAGGTGWRDYLKTYSQGMQAIDQKAMAAEAARLFKDSPQEYVRLVRGNNPDAVEAIFGPGSYDIFKEMGSKMPTLEKVASNVERGATMEEAAQKGTEELGKIADKYSTNFKIPWGLSAKTAAINKGLDVIEKRLGTKISEKLQEGMRSGKSALEMLNTFPAVERIKILRALTDPASWKGSAARAATAQNPTNNLYPEEQNKNALTER